MSPLSGMPSTDLSTVIVDKYVQWKAPCRQAALGISCAALFLALIPKIAPASKGPRRGDAASFNKSKRFDSAATAIRGSHESRHPSRIQPDHRHVYLREHFRDGDLVVFGMDAGFHENLV